jgi:hypothetical protein
MDSCDLFLVFETPDEPVLLKLLLTLVRRAKEPVGLAAF